VLVGTCTHRSFRCFSVLSCSFLSTPICRTDGVDLQCQVVFLAVFVFCGRIRNLRFCILSLVHVDIIDFPLCLPFLLLLCWFFISEHDFSISVRFCFNFDSTSICSNAQILFRLWQARIALTCSSVFEVPLVFASRCQLPVFFDPLNFVWVSLFLVFTCARFRFFCTFC